MEFVIILGVVLWILYKTFKPTIVPYENPTINKPNFAVNAGAVDALSIARSNLAKVYGKNALTSDGVRTGYQKAFRRDWRECCRVVEAKYGATRTEHALDLLGLENWR